MKDFVKSKKKECIEGITKYTKFLTHKDADVRNSARNRIRYYKDWLSRIASK